MSMLWNNHESRILVAGHRGVRYTAPENTMTAFRKAMSLGVDMIETDVRMTIDEELVLMHDETVNRTTDGTGFVRDMTLEQIMSLNAARDYEDFSPEAPPTLEEFLTFCSNDENMLIDIELKDYPEAGRESFAYRCADKTIALIERNDLVDRCVLNSFSGKLLEYVDENYNGRYRLHGYYPYEIMKDCQRKPASYLFCLCIMPVKPQLDNKLERLNFNVCPRSYFDKVIADGIAPWIGASIHSEDELMQSVERGASLITTDYPADILQKLRTLGLHI